MEEERDVVVFTDDNGNEFELDVIDYFDYEGEEYAVLMDLSHEECDCSECAESCEGEDADIYIMKVITSGDTEEFVAADEDKMDALSAIVEERLSCEDDEDDGGDEHGDGCGCGCHHED